MFQGTFNSNRNIVLKLTSAQKLRLYFYLNLVFADFCSRDNTRNGPNLTLFAKNTRWVNSDSISTNFTSVTSLCRVYNEYMVEHA